MKNLIIFLFMFGMPMIAFADTTESPQLLVEQYDSTNAGTRMPFSHKSKFSVLTGKEEILKKVPYDYIVAALQKQIKSGWWQELAEQEKYRADYHIVFVDIGFPYSKKWSGRDLEIPILDPALPASKFEDAVAKNAMIAYRFVSPWMRGTLYIREGKPVGGNIILPISAFAQINELYHIENKEWDAARSRDSTKLEEMSVPEDVYKATTDRYKKILLKGKDFSKQDEQLEKKLKTMDVTFVHTDETSSSPKRLVATLTLPPTVLYKSISVFDICFKQSEIFYSHLYEHLFTQLFTKITYEKDDNKIHDITPSAEILQSLHEAAGNYNCFSPNFEELKK